MRTAAAVALLVSTFLTPGASGGKSAECLVGFDGVGARRGGTITRPACDGTCSFEVRVCIDLLEDGRPCPAGPVRTLQALSSSPVPPITLPEIGHPGSCATATVHVPAGERAGRTTLRVRARGDRHRDRDRLVLRCFPNPTNAGCNLGGTTSSTTAITSTTGTTLEEPPTVTTTSTVATSTTAPATETCVRTGCSGQLCADRHLATTCEWYPRYACYRDAVCTHLPGRGCGWMDTEELRRCLAESPGPATQQPG